MAKHFKLTVGSMFRLAAITAIALCATRWIPRWSKTPDGITSYYTLKFDGHRHYYALTGNELGFRFEARVKKVPGYAELKSYYPNGNLRENSQVYVETQTDGLRVRREQVESGNFYRLDGSIYSSVEKGTGVITTTRPNGTVLSTVALDNGRIVGRKSWYRNGNLSQEARINGLASEVTDYFPEGMPWHRWTSENGRIIESTYYDREGNEVSKPVAFPRAGMY